ncbi:MAG: hypothetical protein QOH88_1638 [Verrucomicrobiota bacterium]
MARGSSDQTVPIERTEKGPDRYRANVGTVIPRRPALIPDLHQPAHLLVRRASDVGLGNYDRRSVTPFDFVQTVGQPGELAERRAHRRDVRIVILPVTAARFGLMSEKIAIEITLTRDVIIHADDVRWARMDGKEVDLSVTDTGPFEVTPQRVFRSNPARQEVPGDPAPLVLEMRLIMERRRAESFSEILCLNELRVRPHLTNRSHRQDDPPTLCEERSRETQRVGRVRIPVSVKSAEARCGQRFVDRSIGIERGITSRDRGRITGELFGKLRIEKIRSRRSTAMMQQTCNRANPELAQPSHVAIAPAPIDRSIGGAGQRFPQDGKAQRPQAQLREPIQIALALPMAGSFQLVEEAVTDSIDCALDSAPELQAVRCFRFHS